MEALQRQECQATILRDNSTIYIYCCDPYYDEVFTIPSLPFKRYMAFTVILVFLINQRRDEIASYRTPRLLFLNWTALNLLVSST